MTFEHQEQTSLGRVFDAASAALGTGQTQALVEQGRYEVLMAEFRWYLARHGLATSGNGFEALVRRAGYDPAARQALQAQRQARTRREAEYSLL